MPSESALVPPLLLESVPPDDAQCYQHFTSRNAVARIALRRVIRNGGGDAIIVRCRALINPRRTLFCRLRDTADIEDDILSVRANIDNILRGHEWFNQQVPFFGG